MSTSCCVPSTAVIGNPRARWGIVRIPIEGKLDILLHGAGCHERNEGENGKAELHLSVCLSFCLSVSVCFDSPSPSTTFIYLLIPRIEEHTPQLNRLNKGDRETTVVYTCYNGCRSKSVSVSSTHPVVESVIHPECR